SESVYSFSQTQTITGLGATAQVTRVNIPIVNEIIRNGDFGSSAGAITAQLDFGTHLMSPVTLQFTTSILQEMPSYAKVTSVDIVITHFYQSGTHTVDQILYRFNYEFAPEPIANKYPNG